MSAFVKINDRLTLILDTSEFVTVIIKAEGADVSLGAPLQGEEIDRMIMALQAVKIAKESKPFPPEFNSLFGENVEDLFA